MSWGSADLVPTSWPLRSESALGSVVPLPCPPPRLKLTLPPEVALNQGGDRWEANKWSASNQSSNGMRPHGSLGPHFNGLAECIRQLRESTDQLLVTLVLFAISRTYSFLFPETLGHYYVQESLLARSLRVLGDSLRDGVGMAESPNRMCRTSTWDGILSFLGIEKEPAQDAQARSEEILLQSQKNPAESCVWIGHPGVLWPKFRAGSF